MFCELFSLNIIACLILLYCIVLEFLFCLVSENVSLAMRGGEIVENLGRNIKFYREQKNLTQQQLAEMAETERSNISKIETGESPGSLPLFFRIADALGVSASELLDGQAVCQVKGA